MMPSNTIAKLHEKYILLPALNAAMDKRESAPYKLYFAPVSKVVKQLEHNLSFKICAPIAPVAIDNAKSINAMKAMFFGFIRIL